MTTPAKQPPSTADSSAANGIVGVVLAGGQGRRMGFVDKGLRLLQGKPMVNWVCERLLPQVVELIINANQNVEQYAASGHVIVKDIEPDFAGPLAGLHAALSYLSKHTAHTLLVSAPCDAPFLPADLVARLKAALQAEDADLAVAYTFTQAHPVFCLCQVRVLPHLEAFLQGGGRKIDAWYATLKVCNVAFDDEAEAFRNINTDEALREAEQIQGVRPL